jgi:hypothetical protein
MQPNPAMTLHSALDDGGWGGGTRGGGVGVGVDGVEKVVAVRHAVPRAVVVGDGRHAVGADGLHGGLVGGAGLAVHHREGDPRRRHPVEEVRHPGQRRHLRPRTPMRPYA